MTTTTAAKKPSRSRTKKTPSEFEVVLEAVREAVPKFRANGGDAENRRWLPDENIELLAQSGVSRIAVPRRLGGLDLSLVEIAKVLAEVGRGCGSTGWVASAFTEGAWLATMLPDKAQEEVFADGEARLSVNITPTGMFVDSEDGYLLNGAWAFASGCRGASWSLIPGGHQCADGTWDALLAAVPTSELSIADDWHVSAAAGTGSSTVSAENVFVPAHRAITVDEMLHGGAADRSNIGATGRNYSLISLVLVESAATIVGTARGAYELFLERVPGRPISYTAWFDQAQHPLTQITVATAAGKLAAAEGLVERWATILQERADAGIEPTAAEKLAARGQCSYAIQLAKETVEILHNASGASIIRSGTPFLRFYRDVQAFSLHALLQPNAGLENYGRALLGLEPSTEFI